VLISQDINKYISTFGIVFFDFDGTIKQTELIKSEAFYSLFSGFGRDVATRIKRHHENNSGVSRFIKLPLYIKWSGLFVTKDLVNHYSNQFSELVFKKIISSEWVEGVKFYIDNFHEDQILCVVSATPEKELKEIILELGIIDCFNEVFGYPNSKVKSIHKCLIKYNVEPKKAVMIGDSLSDYNAAQENNIEFVLHRTSINKDFYFKGRVI
jgi:phosphoglycolate phosphatase-like HAD superfamily hydrolase